MKADRKPGKRRGRILITGGALLCFLLTAATGCAGNQGGAVSGKVMEEEGNQSEAASGRVMEEEGNQSGAASGRVMEKEENQSDAPSQESHTERRTLRVGMECAYAPNNWEEDHATDTNLPISNNEGFYAEGYDVQIAKKIGEALDGDLEIVKFPWDGLLEALNQGQVDMIISGMVDSEEHRQAAAFSDTYAIQPTEYSIMVQKDSSYAGAKVLADFFGASILGQKGTKLDTVIDQIPGVNHISPVDTIPNMLDRLNNNTVDGIVINLDSAQAYLKTYPNLTVIDFPDDDGFVLDFSGIAVGVRKDDTELLSEINRALSGISAETRQRLMDEVTAKVGEVQ